MFLFCAVSVCGQTINTTIAAVDTVESGEKFKLQDGFYPFLCEYYLGLDDPFLPIPPNRILCDFKCDEPDFMQKIIDKGYKKLRYYDDNNYVYSIKMEDLSYVIGGELFMNYDDEFIKIDSLASVITIQNKNGEKTYYRFNGYRPFDKKNISTFLFINDTTLLYEFFNIPKKERKNRADDFIRKYNEKHPLRLPVYKDEDIKKTWNPASTLSQAEIYSRRQKAEEIPYIADIKVHTDTTTGYASKYDSAFKFTDGLYWSVKDFVRNLPITEKKIITDIPKNHPHFFCRLYKYDNIRIINTDGDTIETKNKPWGWCCNGDIFVSDRKIIFDEIGSITKYQAVVGQDSTGMDIYNDFFCDFSDYENGYNINSEHRPTYQNLERFLKTHDFEFYEECSAELESLPTRKKDKKVYEIIDRYNQKHPLYIPVYE